MRKLSLLLVVLVFYCLTGNVFAEDLNVIPIDNTASGLYVLATNEYSHGLVLINNQTGRNVTITDGRNAGYYASISADQRYICYKAFMPVEDGGYLQAGMLFDIVNEKNITLTEWSPLVGTPAVAADGTIAYTVGNTLFLADANLSVRKNYDLGCHVNLLDFSKDGNKITYTNDEGQIILLNLASGTSRIVDGKNTYWGPKFSPKGNEILAPTVNGYSALIDVTSGEIKHYGKGEPLGWINEDTFAYLNKEVSEKEGKVKKSKLVMVCTTSQSKEVLEINAGDASVSLKGQNVAIKRKDKMEFGRMNEKKLEILSERNILAPGKSVLKEKVKPIKDAKGDVGINAIYNGTYSVYLTGVPYLHQVYDTADNFNGHWACGASSALMAIQYYGVLANHPMTCSTPTSHTHNFGWYVSNVYTYGRTFNIYGADPNGTSFAGGYGYIIQNDWEDTKTHMKEYIAYHGRGSSVDWSPTFAKTKTEIDADHPFVILTSLTTAGHYVTCRGYYKSQYSLVFNDPYGNKNSGYMNYSGTLVAYDWPGYNNGYANLNTVHCYIYCR